VKRKGFGVAALLVIAGLILWMWAFPSVAVNYRLNLVVDTPNGPRSASVVQREQYSKSRVSQFIGGGLSWVTRGEALVLKLDDARYLFVLLPETIAAASFADAGRLTNWSGGTFAFYRAFLRLKYFTWGTVPIPDDQMPRIVSFHDIREPMSVFLIEPANMEAQLGKGFKFREMTVEISWSFMGKGHVGEVLPWLSDIAPNQLSGDRFRSIKSTNPVAASISPYDFSSEILK
jgi:hypothetical protein